MKYSIVATSFIGATVSGRSVPIADPRPCVPLHHSTAPVPDPNTLDEFTSTDIYNELINGTSVPIGYDLAFSDFNATVNSPSYLSFAELSYYDASDCASLCDGLDGCNSFNLYFQRNPSVTPGELCPNPKANVLTRCALYSESINATLATNVGQNRGPEDANGDHFLIVIRGSNGYNKKVDPSPSVVPTSSEIPLPETVTATVGICPTPTTQTITFVTTATPLATTETQTQVQTETLTSVVSTTVTTTETITASESVTATEASTGSVSPSTTASDTMTAPAATPEVPTSTASASTTEAAPRSVSELSSAAASQTLSAARWALEFMY